MGSGSRPATVAAALLLLAILALSLQACGSESGSADVSHAAVLKEMKAAFGADVTAVHVADNSGSVRIDVFTTYYPDPDGAEAAGGVARAAAQSAVVLASSPSTRIDAFVWPTGKEFYMTRASASYTDSKLDGPMDVFTNAGLQ